ncbi:MAG TPA: hypothetical protein VFR91_09000, partial [Dyella sp.]|nr:hypothetical protein [Dyella sp.]
GQSSRPLQGAHTSHLRTLSKINHLRSVSRIAPKRFASGEPLILHRFHWSSTLFDEVAFEVVAAQSKIVFGEKRAAYGTTFFRLGNTSGVMSSRGVSVRSDVAAAGGA